MGKILQINNIDTARIPALLDLSAEEQGSLYRAAMIDELKDEARGHIQAIKTERRLDGLVGAFLDGYQNKHTKASYAHSVDLWRKYLSAQGIAFASAKGMHVQHWINAITAASNGNIARVRVAAVSALYAYLMRDGIVKRNPCAGVPLPKRIYKKAIRPDMQHGGSSVPVMSQNEAKKILAWLERDTHVSQRVTDSVKLIHAYGLRVGALPTLKRIQGGFSVTTKGKRQSFACADVPDVSGVTVRMMQHAVKRATRALYSAEEIRHPYSCHDFRHCFCVTHYMQHRDVVALKEIMGHASIAVTDYYLVSLGVHKSEKQQNTLISVS